MAELVQLAQTFKPGKHSVKGWYISEKLDGMYALWDGGISKGLPISDIPYANTLKGRTDTIATGLWSRLGNVIHAPHHWLIQAGLTDAQFPVVGEIWGGYGMFQTTLSAARSHAAGEQAWHRLRFCSFDAPPPVALFSPREVRVNNNQKYTIPDSVLSWVLDQGIDMQRCAKSHWPFEKRLQFLKNHFGHSPLFQTILSQEAMDGWLEEVLGRGGEGLMAKDPKGLWLPKRDSTILKIKPFDDLNAIVKGWTPGLGKFEGMMGSLLVAEVKEDDFTISDEVFNVSGFTDAERELRETSEGLFPRSFRLGDRIRVKFRGRTDDGLPREARYWRSK